MIGKSNVENAGVGCLNVNFDKLNKGDFMAILDAGTRLDVLRSISEKMWLDQNMKPSMHISDVCDIIAKIDTQDNGEDQQRTEAKISDSIPLDDALAFAEYFRHFFEFHDSTDNGNTYRWLNYPVNRLPAMTIKQAFDQWKSRNE